MGILKKLFGKKKKEEKVEKPQGQAQPEAESKDVSLQDVNEELKNLKTIEDDKDIEKQEVPSKTDTEEVETKKPQSEAKPKAVPKKETASDKPVYHIKKHKDGWQVMKAGADKAYRVFKYQKEAIDFAKEEDLEHIVYKSDGTPRDI